MLVYEGEKLDYLEKKLSEQDEEPTDLTQIWTFNSGHIGEREVLS